VSTTAAEDLPPRGAALVEARDLSIGYDGVPLLSGLDFAILRGDVFVILGGSGCGKSTLLRFLIGLQEPLAGSVTHHMPGVHGDAPPPFGVMFQSGALFSSMTLLENVMLPLERWTSLSRDAAETIAAARLRLVDLQGFEGHLPADISGGMKKRAGIARALALDPPLLFLDEPGAGLDPINSVELDDLIARLRDDLGVTTVMVTHGLESILRVGTDCIMLDKDARGIIARGDPRELHARSDDPRVRRFFHREARERR